MNILLSEQWLRQEARACVLRYLPIQCERVVVLPFTAEDIATWDLDEARHRVRYAVREGLGLHPMVDCFRFEIDGY